MNYQSITCPIDHLDHFNQRSPKPVDHLDHLNQRSPKPVDHLAKRCVHSRSPTEKKLMSVKGIAIFVNIWTMCRSHKIQLLLPTDCFILEM
jgi:hypothetical protein